MSDQAAHDILERVKVIPERGYDAEVAAPTAKAPKQVLIRMDHATVGGDQLRADQVVAGEAVLADQPTPAAAQGKAGDARAGDLASGGGQTVGMGGLVEVKPRRPGLRDGGARVRIHAD